MDIKLNERQQIVKEHITQCVNGSLRTLEAAVKLGLTQRAVEIKIRRYKTLGDSSFIHGNTGKKHINETYVNLKNRIIKLFQNTVIDGKNPFESISYQYFNDILKEEYNIKCSTGFVTKCLKSVGYKSPIKWKSRRKVKEYLYREPKEYFGELVQADGTPYDWFKNGKNYCIQGFIDDATGIPVGLYMTKNECLLGYIEAARYMLINYGIPEQLYPDKAGVFFVNNPKCKDKNALTQFGRIVSELGIDMFPAHSPQAKGRIERFWGVLQQQLPVQFALHGIKTVEQANKFLNEVYIPKYVKKYSRKAKSDFSKFVAADKDKIAQLLKARFIGNTDSAGIFYLKGYKFFCKELPHQKIHICLSYKNGLWVEPFKSNTKYIPKLIETDTSGDMPEVMKILIEETFLKNCKPSFREVYYSVSDELLC